MSRRRFNFAQRFVVVVGVGIALSFVGRWVTSLGSQLTMTGWTGYAPLSPTSVSPFVGGLRP
ncbi:MAG TPA: hypothetical protein VII67_04325 [Acidimicrobiales bacterium]